MAYQSDRSYFSGNPQTTAQVIGNMHMIMASLPEGVEKQTFYSQISKLTADYNTSQYRA